MARPFYSAPVKYRPDFPLLPGQVRLPPPHVLTGPPPQPPPPGTQPPGFTSDKPWMTPQLVAEIRRRNFLQNQAARSSSEQDRAAAEQQRQLVNRLVNDAKERFCLAHPARTDEILASDRRSRPFHCGSCDRSYGSQQQLDEHCREHVRCGLDDCPFTAHPRVVEKHVTMQHQTGLAKVIMALNTPEAIARWREQRRANFCRPESAARRQAEQAERAARGIRLSARGGRFPPAEERPGRGRGGSRGRGRGRGGGGRGRGARPRPTQPQAPLSDSEEETPRGLPSFAGILAEPAAGPGGGGRSDGGSEADSDPGEEDGVDLAMPAAGCGGLAGTERGSQDGKAGSSPVPMEGGPERPHSDNPMEAEEAAETGTARVTAESKPDLGGDGDGEVGTSGDPDPASTAAEPGGLPAPPAPADLPPGASTGPQLPVGPSGRARPDQSGPGTGGRGGRGGRWRGRGRRGGGTEQPPRKRRRPLTLLEKLLATDIRRERNIILQCVRHVVNEDFFDGRPLGAVRAAPPVAAGAGEAPEADGRPDGGPRPAEGGPVSDPEQEAVVPAPDRTVPDQEAVVQTEGGPAESDRAADRQSAETKTETTTEQPVPRLLGGAYYDSDSITDSD